MTPEIVVLSKLGGPLTRCAGYGNGREIPEAREAVGSGG
jgi:hypothetical protein